MNKAELSGVERDDMRGRICRRASQIITEELAYNKDLSESDIIRLRLLRDSFNFDKTSFEKFPDAFDNLMNDVITKYIDEAK